MRLSEALGLTEEDINLNNSTTHIRIILHPGRRLKTRISERCIPHVGASLWTCQQILEHNNDSIFAFPRYQWIIATVTLQVLL